MLLCFNSLIHYYHLITTTMRESLIIVIFFSFCVAIVLVHAAGQPQPVPAAPPARQRGPPTPPGLGASHAPGGVRLSLHYSQNKVGPSPRPSPSSSSPRSPGGTMAYLATDGVRVGLHISQNKVRNGRSPLRSQLLLKFSSFSLWGLGPALLLTQSVSVCTFPKIRKARRTQQ